MKKIFSLIAFIGTLMFTSCTAEDVYYTNVVELAGEWKVTVDQVDASGNVIDENVSGTINLLTYNTVADNNEMWIDDLKGFWQTKVKVTVDTENLTFSCSNVTDEYCKGTKNEYQATITDGRMKYDATTSSLGYTVDEISFTIQFSDAPGEYYRFHGYRRTGFAQGAD